MAQPGDFASTVKQQADIVRIVGEYVKLRKAGAQNYSGLCPFHQEKTASFSVHAGNQFFHCFGCNAGGDVFTFVQKIENITFPEAVRMVAEKLGIPMPKVSYSSPEEAAPGEAAWRPARHSRARLHLLSGAAQATRGGARPRISEVAWADARDHRRVPHWLRAGVRLPVARCGARPVRRRHHARVGPVFVEGQGRRRGRATERPRSIPSFATV